MAKYRFSSLNFCKTQIFFQECETVFFVFCLVIRIQTFPPKRRYSLSFILILCLTRVAGLISEKRVFESFKVLCVKMGFRFQDFLLHAFLAKAKFLLYPSFFFLSLSFFLPNQKRGEGKYPMSACIAEVARVLKPRYHFVGLEGIFYERQPYRCVFSISSFAFNSVQILYSSPL